VVVDPLSVLAAASVVIEFASTVSICCAAGKICVGCVFDEVLTLLGNLLRMCCVLWCVLIAWLDGAHLRIRERSHGHSAGADRSGGRPQPAEQGMWVASFPLLLVLKRTCYALCSLIVW
jgi:hypothetical protein